MKNIYLCILTNQMKMNSFNDNITSFGAQYADATALKMLRVKELVKKEEN